jgi:small subunit ribosomal protein S20
MANHKSAIKRIRQNEKRSEYNTTIRSRARTYVKKARVTAAANNAVVATAEEATRIAIQELDRAASKGVIHKRNAARRKSRLMLQLNALKNGS